ncbi:MAG: 4'-phosphopantetheinyl transferase superfamily protein [Clostridia bacterium]|nr:4'-phosphopantetheinyl transferase superfamily protein [Clostridia bacterium]
MLKYVVKKVSEINNETLKRSFFCMNKERRAKVKGHKNVLKKKCTLVGEWLVREMLSEITEKEPEFFIISADEKGKLHSENTPWLHFNISHSDDTVAAVVCDCQVGIDIETIRKVSLSLAKRVCNEGELVYIFEKLPSEDDFRSEDKDFIKRFLEIWTIKEAYFKCIGTGITNFKAVNALSEDFKKIKITEDNYIMHMVMQSKPTVEPPTFSNPYKKG